jgi:hypothetical protein
MVDNTMVDNNTTNDNDIEPASISHKNEAAQ